MADLVLVIAASVRPGRIRCFVPPFHVVSLPSSVTMMCLYWGIAGHLRRHPVHRLPMPPHLRATDNTAFRDSHRLIGDRASIIHARFCPSKVNCAQHN